MKKTILTFIFLFSLITLISSQKIELETEFLKEIIVQEKDSMIYVGESYGWQKMIEKFNRKKFQDYNLNNSNTIELTEVEYNYILKEIKTNQSHIWSSNLFDNSERFNQNDIESHLQRKNKPAELEFQESLKIDDTSAVVELKNKTYHAYAFSKPIFFRKNKFCIFAYHIITGKKIGDYKQIAFYKKEKGKWIEWLEIYNNLN